MIGVVIPTLDAAATLPATLAALREGAALIAGIVVSDGGSRDGTPRIAARGGCAVVRGERGRGGQLARGAAAAPGEWLLFLHADTRPEAGWAGAAADFMARGGGRAAAFRFALDDPGRAARLVERAVAMRNRLLALPYGDQGLLIARPLYEAVGGYGALPLMEDVDLVRRLGRRRLAGLPVRAVTSAARYRRGGYAPRILRNAACLSLYYAGISPGTIARLYG
ncbi:hypothetical protein OPKNFCMD_0782 [Methylobacterium crusticola]|uniref:Glycosyltransferase 2-like domain-containing protein n=1 Tax=Methylobacterium crusticola TaxID=1697972 RepID=A0ABQ4QTR7_9HYPH|nr:TIGR04283 family arsenosugar biosynthesis glycosyltransferase [Methylobacterium crusticola]GJD48066.1 hypothetical protein OPKNFCMD_0782 [Methylobacterium crusticola]